MERFILKKLLKWKNSPYGAVKNSYDKGDISRAVKCHLVFVRPY